MLGLRDVLFIAPQNQTTIITSSSDHTHNHNHNHHQTNIPLPSSTSLGVGLGIFPLLTATPCVPTPTPPPPPNPNPNPSCNPEAYHYWSLKKFHELNSSKQDHHHHHHHHHHHNQLLLATTTTTNNGDGDDHDQEEEEEAQMVESDGGGNSNLRACKDCGNRAKKDCGFKRCRTCCKARGFDCSTHVRSTWVPASRRRERHEMVVLGGGGDGSSGSSSGGVKRQRVLVPSQIGNNNSGSHASTSNVNTPRSFDFGSAHQDASFKQSLPGKVQSPAAFRCHRVTAISNGEAEFAYQATVRISGHVFKGYLYDHGVDEKNSFPCISALHLAGSTSRRNGDSSSPIVNPSNAHLASAN